MRGDDSPNPRNHAALLASVGMGARICPRCSTRVDERRARTSPFCLSCGAPLGAPPSATFAGKQAGGGGGSPLPWILGGIAAVVLLGFGAVVVVLVAAAGSAEPDPATGAASAASPRVETADAAAVATGSAAKVATPAPTPTVRTPRPSTNPTVVATVPPPPTAPPTSTVTALGPFPRSKAQGEVDRIGFGLNTCKSSAGPFGAGTMRVDFEPDGRVGTLTRPPFAGTSVGTCISARFRTIKIGPFTGTTQSIEKAFIIQE